MQVWPQFTVSPKDKRGLQSNSQPLASEQNTVCHVAANQMVREKVKTEIFKIDFEIIFFFFFLFF